ncbi:UvrD-helicase domain-containing protein [Clostridium sp. AUH-JLR23]|uniref:UvrD-helicase domain-containing protein n=1 Tax=Clostridium sp. AUH-JLR23 TaxID=1505062 RepID=UPI0035658ACB
MPFNAGQLKAIQQRDASILVSAPAGSGKTKILVSRIVELLKEGYQISDFLVVTFTQAAGHEMKQRLTEELNTLVSSPIDETLKAHLQEQILHLPHAYITNFHGFCNLLLMKYGYLVGVMPGFEINSDPSQIKNEVLDECLEKWIQDSHICDFLTLYFPGYSLDSFKSLLLSIDDMSHSIDHFYDFINQIKSQYYETLSPSLEDWPLFSYLKNIFYNEVVMAMNKLVELEVYCEEHDLIDFYERPDEQTERNQALRVPFEAYYDYLDERLQALSQAITYDTLVSLLKTPVEKAYNMSWKDIDPQIKKTFTKMKTDVLSSYQKAVSAYLEDDSVDFVKKLKVSFEAIDILLSKGQLLDQFQHAYQQRKKELNQLDFADLESYTHQLLLPQYGIVDILYHRLKEIMIDEYQDTNQIQESLISMISTYQDPPIPLFMVGDMKQSIYRFRQADPQIFLDKYNHFSLTDEESLQSQTRRIDLVFNYRSSKIVLDSINFIFNQIMDSQIGGLEYYLDDSARLNYDYDGKEKGHQKEARERFFKEDHLTTEVMIDFYNPASSLDKEQYEAHMVAQKILKLKEIMTLEGKPVSYKDMVVLMRSTTSFLTFKKVFDQYHIPNHIVLSQGFMNTNEIKNMLSFLKAIDNPYDDVSLLSVINQPYTCSYISLETIAKIRIDHKDLPLYENLKLSNDQDILSFLQIFEELRAFAKQNSPYDLLKKIYEITDYPLFVCQLVNGEQRKANLLLLLELTKQFQQQHPYLHDFIEAFLESSDQAPAIVASQDDDFVEFMTIHKSKGLEFPIVFVCNMHKQFNTQDSKERFMIDKQLGIALKPRRYVETENFGNITVEYENCYRNMIARHQLDESINEEMRILYVALTRASQKLILTGVLKSIDEIKDIMNKLIINEHPDIYHKKNAEHVLLYDRLRKTNNYLSWVLAAILRHPHVLEQCLNIDELKPLAKKLQKYHFEKHLTFDSTEHAMFSLVLTTDAEIEEKISHQKPSAYNLDSQIQEHYQNYQYPHDISKPAALAVTKLPHIEDEHSILFTESDETATISATDKGTLVHLLLSYLTFEHDDVEALIQQLYNEALIDEEGQNILFNYQDKIQGFIDSEYYQMIRNASHVYKEKSFSYYDETLQQTIHGIFDLVFVYQDQIYVLDYKTDRVSRKNTDEVLIQKHQTQLSYYQKVLKDMYHQDIKAIIYYLNIAYGVEF